MAVAKFRRLLALSALLDGLSGFPFVEELALKIADEIGKVDLGLGRPVGFLWWMRLTISRSMVPSCRARNRLTDADTVCSPFSASNATRTFEAQLAPPLEDGKLETYYALLIRSVKQSRHVGMDGSLGTFFANELQIPGSRPLRRFFSRRAVRAIIAEYDSGSSRHARFLQRTAECLYTKTVHERDIQSAKAHLEFLLNTICEVARLYTGDDCSASIKIFLQNPKDEKRPLVATLARDMLPQNSHRRDNDEGHPVWDRSADTAFISALQNSHGYFFANDLLELHKQGKYNNMRENWFKDYNATAVRVLGSAHGFNENGFIGFICVDNRYGHFDSKQFRDMLGILARGVYDVLGFLSCSSEILSSAQNKSPQSIADLVSIGNSLPTPSWRLLASGTKEHGFELMNPQRAEVATAFLGACYSLNVEPLPVGAEQPPLDKQEGQERASMSGGMRMRNEEPYTLLGVLQGITMVLMVTLAAYCISSEVLWQPPESWPSSRNIIIWTPLLLLFLMIPCNKGRVDD